MAKRRPFTMSVVVSEYRGDWNGTNRFYAGDIVRHTTGIYGALKATHNVEPTPGINWILIFPPVPFTPPVSTLPSGVIVQWAGAISAIPADWYLCNGEHDTPDLAGYFCPCVRKYEEPGPWGTGATKGEDIQAYALAFIQYQPPTP